MSFKFNSLSYVMRKIYKNEYSFHFTDSSRFRFVKRLNICEKLATDIMSFIIIRVIFEIKQVYYVLFRSR